MDFYESVVERTPVWENHADNPPLSRLPIAINAIQSMVHALIERLKSHDAVYPIDPKNNDKPLTPILPTDENKNEFIP